MKTKIVNINYKLELEVPEPMSRIEIVVELSKRFNLAASEIGKLVNSNVLASGGENEKLNFTTESDV